MARYTQSERRLRRTRRERQLERELRRTLNDDTRHGVIGVVLYVVAGISLLSFFGLAGPLGEQIAKGEAALFGWTRYLVPIILLVVGTIFFAGRRRLLGASLVLGLLLLLLSIAGLSHLFFEPSAALTQARAGAGGGYLGYGIALPLLNITGRVAAFVLLFALLLIGFFVTFNTSLGRLAERSAALRAFLLRLHVLRGQRAAPVINGEWQAEESAPGFTERPIGTAPKERPAMMPADRSGDPGIPTLEPLHVRQRPRRVTSIPLDLLNDASTKPTSGDVKANAAIIQRTLENFGISVEAGDVNVGPTVTQYTLKPAEGVRLAQIVTLKNDLALALAAHPIRIEAPIPGKSLVGVEVPNKATAIVSLKELLAAEEFRRKKSNLTFALGKDVAGTPAYARLDTMPHLLIAGATGSGKSVCINTIILSLLYQNQPEELKFILVDPKRVELTIYNDIPHLITPVITEVKKTVNALKWAVAEMDRRYRVLSEAGARNIAAYNGLTGIEPLPYIVVIIDELADLMAASANEVEGAIVRLAQMARAVGMHLIVATQRPSVDVITGLIKANITSRIAFSVASVIDSRTILDGAGAETLLGRGDMLYLSAELSKPRRLQGALVSDQEIQRVVEHLRQQANPEYEETIVEAPTTGLAESDGSSEDDLYNEAKAIIIQAGKASASLLQRRLRIGYARAARLLDILEEKGVIGPLDGARPREVLVNGGTEGLPEDAETGEERLTQERT